MRSMRRVVLVLLISECIYAFDHQHEVNENPESLILTQSISSTSSPESLSSPATSSSDAAQWQDGGKIFVGQVDTDEDSASSFQKIDFQRQNETIKNGARVGKNSEHEGTGGRRYSDPLSSLLTDSSSTSGNHSATTSRILQGIYGRLSASERDDVRRERLQQMNLWLSEKDSVPLPPGTRISSISSPSSSSGTDESDESGMKAEPLKGSPFLIPPMLLSPVYTPASGKSGTTGVVSNEEEPSVLHHAMKDRDSIDRIGMGDEEPEGDSLPDEEDNQHHAVHHSPEAHSHVVGTSKTPPCGSHGRFYCSYKEDYPVKVVGEVSKYYKWPLEKLFRDLRQQVMPKLANDNYGGLVCDSVTRVVRPGWARNTNNRWLVVINTDLYQQFVTEVICRNGPSAPCNFIPPCYQATCAQRYNTQKLLVIDPWNPYKGPFVSEFLFPSCCICYVPSYTPGEAAAGSSNRRIDKTPFADRRTSGETSTVKAEL